MSTIAKFLSYAELRAFFISRSFTEKPPKLFLLSCDGVIRCHSLHYLLPNVPITYEHTLKQDEFPVYPYDTKRVGRVDVIIAHYRDYISTLHLPAAAAMGVYFPDLVYEDHYNNCPNPFASVTLYDGINIVTKEVDNGCWYLSYWTRYNHEGVYPLEAIFVSKKPTFK